MSTQEPLKSPIPSGSGAHGGSKLDQLSKEDLVKFAKKQVINLNEMKKNQGSLMGKLKLKLEELEKAKQEVVALQAVNEKLATDGAQKSQNRPTECTECLAKSGRLIELEKELIDLKDRAAKADMFSLELRDLESKVDNLNRSLREKGESLAKAHEVIAENDINVQKLSQENKELKSSVDKLTETNNRLTKSFQDEKSKSSDLEARLRSAECRITELSDQQGNEKMGLAKKMAESEHRGILLEEAIEVLRNENETLTAKAEDSNQKYEQIENEFAEFKNKARFVLEKKGKQEDDNREILDKLEKAENKAKELEDELVDVKKDYSKTLNELSTCRDKVDRIQRELESTRMNSSDFEKNHLCAMDDLRLTSSKTIQRLEEDLRLLRASRDSAEHKCREITVEKEKKEHLLHTERQRAESENGTLKTKLENASKQVKQLEREIQELKAESQSRSVVHQQMNSQKAVAAVTPQPVAVIDHYPVLNHRPVASIMSDSVSCYDEQTQQERSLEHVLYGDLENNYKLDGFEWSEEKFNSLVEELENMKKTNTHVSELLNEAESANGRLVSQNKLLKEEIRRLERKEERDEELSNEKNMEYLKNVIVQFLKPESVQTERNQLIVVLQRVLHLSPKEVDVLKVSAEQMAYAASSANQSWSSYFSGWSGAQTS